MVSGRTLGLAVELGWGREACWLNLKNPNRLLKQTVKLGSRPRVAQRGLSLMPFGGYGSLGLRGCRIQSVGVGSVRFIGLWV